jgi:hypothetical protein
MRSPWAGDIMPEGQNAVLETGNFEGEHHESGGDGRGDGHPAQAKAGWRNIVIGRRQPE